ncbi:carbon starvation protein A [Permianibacter sp. IMCC34836]|uniref:carbon starvation CstA family protein n=1 Tax=Permianibacter fluminis TaxID=2738515 RepID=UPI0015548FB6|nr:carbon starvation CstA family protein [Permianibacter fluminis]NQD35924.1 carbon starvation protein A [Permianibacter fluminis]
MALWVVLGLVATGGLATIALHQGETINALWLVVTALSVYAIGYRFYARFITDRVLQLNDQRLTPAHVVNDGKDFVPTHKAVLFGHHFAAIAGAGPLIGPVLAAQMGYLPGTIWLVVGVVFAGAVQDMVVLFASTRRNGKSLGDMIREEIGTFAGKLAMFGILAIMIILLAVLALVVVKALIGSPWGVSTLVLTIPIAVFMGVYLRYLRPGRVGEVSLIGVVLLVLSLYAGQEIAHSPALAAWFDLDGKTLAWGLIGYGFIASVLPVWLLLAPRDYLSTFLKIGTIFGLAIGIAITLPELHMPALTSFTDGSGPVFAGSLFPFLFITIACGTVSGFHALVASGTTPKLIERESHIRPIGYGAMLMESFVAVMAMVAACVLTPGVYFALNSPAALIGTTPEQAAAVINSWGFVITPDVLVQTAKDIGESSILSRAGGAPTLAVGMAQIFSSVFGGPAMMAFWYHFAILFEALFILTTLDAGTRVGRFMIQDLLGQYVPKLGHTHSLTANLVATSLCVFGWGYFLYQGVIDPLGGINTLWPLFGIANQMLAAMALLFATVLLVKMRRGLLVWVTALPAAWLLIVTLTASWQKLFHDNVRIGFLSHAEKFRAALERGEILPPAKSLDDMSRIVLNDQINAGLCALFALIVIAMAVVALRACLRIWRGEAPALKEAPFQAAVTQS